MANVNDSPGSEGTPRQGEREPTAAPLEKLRTLTRTSVVFRRGRGGNVGTQFSSEVTGLWLRSPFQVRLALSEGTPPAEAAPTATGQFERLFAD